MVFMEGSLKAAEIANSRGMDIGLHINFTQQFDSPGCPAQLAKSQGRIRRFLKSGKYALLLYNPFLRKHFRTVFEEQLKEFTRVYSRPPSHFDGHQHMHLSSNMLVQRIIPAGQKVRRSFSFRPGEKSVGNRAYRRIVDRKLARRYHLTDFFFALSNNLEPDKLHPLLALGRTANVELMTHTWNRPEYDCLMSETFQQLSRGIELGGYAKLLTRDNSAETREVPAGMTKLS